MKGKNGLLIILKQRQRKSETQFARLMCWGCNTLIEVYIKLIWGHREGKRRKLKFLSFGSVAHSFGYLNFFGSSKLWGIEWYMVHTYYIAFVTITKTVSEDGHRGGTVTLIRVMVNVWNIRWGILSPEDKRLAESSHTIHLDMKD